MNKKLASLLTLIVATTMTAATQLIFVGTYTPKGGASRGIYAVRLDTTTGALSEAVLVAETPNPTFLTLSPDGKMLYAVGDSMETTGKPGGAAVAFRIDPAAPKLIPVNTQATGGASLAHIGIDSSGRTLVTISYGGGQITSFPVNPDGSIGARQDSFKSSGPLGPQKDRQDKPHPHSVTFSPNDRFA